MSMATDTETIRVVVDMSKCSGLGLCEAEAPEVFEIMDDGHLKVLLSVVDVSRRQELQDACDACPTQAITLEG